MLTGKIYGTSYCYYKVDKDWNDNKKPDLLGISEGDCLMAGKRVGWQEDRISIALKLPPSNKWAWFQFIQHLMQGIYLAT